MRYALLSDIHANLPALRAVLDEGGTLEQHWPVRQVLKTGDRATGSELSDS